MKPRNEVLIDLLVGLLVALAVIAATLVAAKAINPKVQLRQTNLNP